MVDLGHEMWRMRIKRPRGPVVSARYQPWLPVALAIQAYRHLGVSYFVQEGEAGPIKIGTTRSSPEGRARSCQTGNHRPLWLVGVSDENERLLHWRFLSARIRGEWFEALPALVDYIRGVRLRSARWAGFGAFALERPRRHPFDYKTHIRICPELTALRLECR